jgi:hypothetical protein
MTLLRAPLWPPVVITVIFAGVSVLLPNRYTLLPGNGGTVALIGMSALALA